MGGIYVKYQTQSSGIRRTKYAYCDLMKANIIEVSILPNTGATLLIYYDGKEIEINLGQISEDVARNIVARLVALKKGMSNLYLSTVIKQAMADAERKRNNEKVEEGGDVNV